MRMDARIWERYSLWPIQLRVLTGAGTTLWGSGGEEEDRLLVVEGHIALFQSEASLRDFVRHGQSCNLTATSGYGRLQEADGPVLTATWGPVKRYDLVTIRHWLEAPRWSWSLARCSTVLDGLHLLWDMARSLGEAAVIEQLQRGTNPLGSFMDALTFLDERERQDTLSRWARSAVREAYEEILQTLSERCVIED